MNTGISFADFENDIEEVANFITSNSKVMQSYQETFRLAGLSGDDTNLMRAAVPYLGSVLLTLKNAFLAGNDNIREWAVSHESEKIILTYIWGKVKHLRPGLNDEEGIALIEELSVKCHTAFERVQKKTNEARIIKTTAKRAKEAVWGISKVGSETFFPKDLEALFGQNDKNDDEREPYLVRTQTKKNIVTLMSVSWDKDKLPSLQRLNGFDLAVHNAVGSLYYGGNEYITSNMIYQALTGNKEQHQTPTKEILRNIWESIRRMSLIRLDIDTTQEFKAKLNIHAEYSGNLLATETARVEINGVLRDCIRMLAAPLLFRYADAKNQIARANIKILDVPISKTQENISLTDYLARRVAMAKSKKNDAWRVIRYDTIYDYLLINANEYSEQGLRNKKKEVRDKIKRILNDWAAKGEIAGFEEVSEGRTKTKVIITVGSGGEKERPKGK